MRGFGVLSFICTLIFTKTSEFLVSRSLRSREGGCVVHFSGKALKMNHLFSFCANKASVAKSY
ncbi:MAG: hypothetical protein U5L45_17710 [Saprospiraceae bacterium]|nr:hypothetical protein [Saprospiraceae bacterium]